VPVTFLEVVENLPKERLLIFERTLYMSNAIVDYALLLAVYPPSNNLELV
jgi:hypothetical protein